VRRQFIYIIVLSLLPFLSQAQFGFANMVELTGVVMSSDSLRYLPYVSVEVEGENRGVVSSEKGVFSLIVKKGSKVKFSNLGFKEVQVKVPENLEGIRYSIIQLMVQDTFYLPTTIIRPALSKEEFERAFVNWNIPMDQLEKARRNTEMNTIRAMAMTLPKDGGENTGYYQQLELQRRYWAGGQPPMNIFSPFAWADFFKAWKRGDYRRKK
jgi:hypothetical protein